MRPYINNKPFMRRFLYLAYGLLVLIWLSLEDHSIFIVTILGGLGALLLGFARYQQGRIKLRTFKRWQRILFASSLASLALLLTVMLMFFKNAWHGHLYPDYPPLLLLAMLQRLPLWALAGACFALAGEFLQAFNSHDDSRSQ